jgi:hypothetical protein
MLSGAPPAHDLLLQKADILTCYEQKEIGVFCASLLLVYFPDFAVSWTLLRDAARVATSCGIGFPRATPVTF